MKSGYLTMEFFSSIREVMRWAYKSVPGRVKVTINGRPRMGILYHFKITTVDVNGERTAVHWVRNNIFTIRNLEPRFAPLKVVEDLTAISRGIASLAFVTFNILVPDRNVEQMHEASCDLVEKFQWRNKEEPVTEFLSRDRNGYPILSFENLITRESEG